MLVQQVHPHLVECVEVHKKNIRDKTKRPVKIEQNTKLLNTEIITNKLKGTIKEGVFCWKNNFFIYL